VNYAFGRLIDERELPVAVFRFVGLREGELRGVEWQDYSGTEITVCRSIWKSVVNRSKTTASRKSVPVIPALAEILDEYRMSMHNPTSGVIFHSGNGCPMAMDKLAQSVIRPAIEAIGLPWYGWHGFRRGIASNLFALGADDKIVQRVLRHAKPHVTRERYIKSIRASSAGGDAENASEPGRAKSCVLASDWPVLFCRLMVSC